MRHEFWYDMKHWARAKAMIDIYIYMCVHMLFLNKTVPEVISASLSTFTCACQGLWIRNLRLHAWTVVVAEGSN